MPTIAIASKRGPKIEALERSLVLIGPFLAENAPIQIETYEIDGGIAMPRSTEQLMTGARRRVERLQEQLRNERRKVDFFVGLEGGFHSIESGGDRRIFLQGWAYVSNGTDGYFGSSGSIEVPKQIALEVMERNRELGTVIDEFAKQHDVRSKQGTWGILTRDLIQRSQSFETALLTAFAPFYNSEFYG